LAGISERTGFNSHRKVISLTIYTESNALSHAPIADGTQKSVQIPINAREWVRCEREQRRSYNVIRIVRLKPNSAGSLRSAGPLIEFAERHLPSVIAALQELASEAA
jgi:hypothetical protein